MPGPTLRGRGAQLNRLGALSWVMPVTDTVIFDGVCNLCARSVQFILKHEASPRFQFAALQSPAGARISSALGFPLTDVSTFVLVSDGKVHTKSGAALRIARHFRSPWKLIRVLWLVPRPLRDWAYDVVARHRYQWFGRAETCMVPTPELETRFLYD